MQELLDFGAGAGKGFSRGTTRWVGSRSPAGSVPQGHGERHGHAAWAAGGHPRLGRAEQPSPTAKAWGGKINGGCWGRQRRGRSWRRERGSSGGPCTAPGGSSAALSLGKGLFPHIPEKPLQTPYLFIFFPSRRRTESCSGAPAAQTWAESTLQWALGGRWETPARCGLRTGHGGSGKGGPGSRRGRAAPTHSLCPPPPVPTAS